VLVDDVSHGLALDEQLTPQQHARLAAELAELEGPKRVEIVQAIAAARAHGDLSENFEYHAAKNEQGLLERRIAILRARLDSASVVRGGGADCVVVGAHVVVEDESGETMKLEISSLGGPGTASPTSPLGAALLGKRSGDTVEVDAPRGAWRAKIIAVRGGPVAD
jgi:transcription elongation factor GreA